MNSGHSSLGTSGLAKLGKVRHKLGGDLAVGGPAPARLHAPTGRRRRSLLRTRSVWRRRAGAAVPLLLAIAVAFALAG